MALQARIEIDTSQLRERLEAASKAVDVESILDDVAALQLSRIRQRFLQQVDTEGTKWIPSFAAINENRNTLIKTGDLFRSLQAFRDGQGRRLVGTSIGYGAVHNFGLLGQEKREFLGFSVMDIDLINRLVTSRLEKDLG